ncbi:hypothetical protein ABIC33_001275 [Variovorax sp. 1140]|uniref:hypothetical protein n=1 Tax=Variovorax atrisoli TaxID=3394203 RepID=UPI003392EF2A
MKIRKYCGQGEMLPRGYGIAWVDFASDKAVCYPVVLNLVAAFLRAAWCFALVGFRPVRGNPRDAFLQGYWRGRADRDQPPEWRRGGF